MATRLYGISRGENMNGVVSGVGSATSADNVEITIDLAANMQKSEVLDSIEKIKNYIFNNQWPPA